MADVTSVTTALRLLEKPTARASTLTPTQRANSKALRKVLQRYSLGTTVLAGASLNFNTGWATTWVSALRTVSFIAGTITVT
jgi:hypothetical protein